VSTPWLALSMELPAKTATRVIVASTVMLTFISYWRAAAVVLADLGSSAFYVPGIAEAAIGKSAAWFILAVMLFSYAVRALYIETSTIFVRGGVYRVVKEGLGHTWAKVAVSALMFDFVLTGPISAVSAGQYLGGFIHDLVTRAGLHWINSDAELNVFSAAFAVAITVYFWWKNIQGMRESSGKALRIMQITTVMVVMLIVWSLLTILKMGPQAHLPPFPSAHSLVFPKESLGWLSGTGIEHIVFFALLIGFGHSILAMSGEETLAQVYREIQSPKVKNLEKAGLVIFVYSLLFTGLAAFFGEMIIPDVVRHRVLLGNLLGELAMHLAGPMPLRLAFQGFVALVGVVMLAGAVNTAIIGSNGVLNRVSEDGVMTAWFRRPHRRYGTTYRLLNLIALLQIVIILISRGNVYVLGEAYAFGLVWSFVFLSMAVLVLRFRRPEGREFKVPLNIRIAGTEIPIGLALTTLVLVSTAIVNLFTKRIATISGVIFTTAFFIMFVVSERITKRQQRRAAHLDEFQVAGRNDLHPESVEIRPGNILVAVRDYNHLGHLQRVLERTDTVKQDVVVVTIRMVPPEASGDPIGPELTDYEQELFTRVVAVAEKSGKPVSLLIVPGSNPFDALVQTAARLRSDTIVAGRSRVLDIREQGTHTGMSWEHLPEPRPRLRLEVMDEGVVDEVFYLGPHNPRLRDKDVALMHDIWLDLVQDPRYRELHHYHVVSLALKRLRHELQSGQRQDVLRGFALRSKAMQQQPAPDADIIEDVETKPEQPGDDQGGREAR
jgi:amino acid transporter/nucleotide-binding universal stress UspA family protein